MFWRKKKLSFDEELAITVRHLTDWVEFMETEISGEPLDAEIADLGDITVANAKKYIAGIRTTLKFLEPLQ